MYIDLSHFHSFMISFLLSMFADNEYLMYSNEMIVFYIFVPFFRFLNLCVSLRSINVRFYAKDCWKGVDGWRLSFSKVNGCGKVYSSTHCTAVYNYKAVRDRVSSLHETHDVRKEEKVGAWGLCVV